MPSSNLADLIRQRGYNRANAEMRRGDISAQMWGNVGNAIAGGVNQYAQHRMEEPIRAQEQKIRDLQLGELEDKRTATQNLTRQDAAFASFLETWDGTPDTLTSTALRTYGPHRGQEVAQSILALTSTDPADEDARMGLLKKSALAAAGNPEALQQFTDYFTQKGFLRPGEDLATFARYGEEPEAPGAANMRGLNMMKAEADLIPTPAKAPENIDAALFAAHQSGDGAEVQRLLRLKHEIAAATRQPREPDPVAQELAQLRLGDARARAESRELLELMPSEWRTAIDRAIMSIPAIRRGTVADTVERLWTEGKQDEVAEVIRQAAIESENVDTQRQVEGRRTAMRALEDIETMLEEVPTGYLRGSMENVARRLGTSTDPKLAELGTRINETMFEYRRAMTGVQFSFAEGKQYAQMFPSYKNDLPLNKAVLSGLRRGMETRDKEFWEQKLGSQGARLVGVVKDGDTAPKLGDVKTFPNGTRGRWDGTGWERIN